MGRSTWIGYAVRLLGVIAIQAAIFVLAMFAIPALPQAAEAIRAVLIVLGYLMPLTPGLLVPKEWTLRRRLIVSAASAAVLAPLLKIDAPAIDISPEVGLVVFAVQVFLAAMISLFPEKSTQPQTT